MSINYDIQSLTWEAIQAAIPAGEAILRVYSTDFRVDIKSDDSPLTRADMESHRIISTQLEATNIPILSEEGKEIPYKERNSWPLFWMIDPLDGTKEFVNRNGEFTVNIALIKEGYPLAGVIYIPVTDVMYIGMPGKGAYKVEGAKQALSAAASVDELLDQGIALPYANERDKFTVVCSRSHMSPETETFINKLRQEHGDLEYASRGSSLKLCMVAEGKADVYPRFAPTMEWDTAAGQAIAEYAGATVVNATTGKRLQYNKENLLNAWFIVAW